MTCVCLLSSPLQMLGGWLVTILVSAGAASILVLVALFVLLRNNVHATVFWNEIVLEKITNFVMDRSKEERILNSVSYNAIKGNPQSVLDCIDDYCSKKEWAMNVGDEKGRGGGAERDQERWGCQLLWISPKP